MADAAELKSRPVGLLEQAEQGTSLWQEAWHRLKKNRMAVFSLIFLILLGIACFPGYQLARKAGTRHEVVGDRTIDVVTWGHEVQNLKLGPTPPGRSHWFGTDALGRDVFARVLFGGRISLMVGLAATGVCLVIGVLYGAIAGFIGGNLDAGMMRVVDVLYALPFTLFVILLMALLDSRSIFLIFMAIGAVEWLTMARIVRGQVMSLRKQEFIEAAFALGLRKRQIILRHIIPNVLGPVIVYATLTVPGLMLLEAFLSFLGLGVQAPDISWGVLIFEGATAMEEFPWMLAFPGAAFATTLFCLNFLGDGLRDALDVRASKD